MTAFLRDFQDLYFAVFCVATQCSVAGCYQHFAENYRFCFQSRSLGSSNVHVLLRGVSQLCHHPTCASHPAGNIITNNLALAYQTTRCNYRIHGVITQKLPITHRNKRCQPRSWHSPTRLHGVINLGKIIPL